MTSTYNLGGDSVASYRLEHPSPCDLDLYLPWACSQLQCSFVVSIIKIIQSEYVNVSTAKKELKGKPKKVRSDTNPDSDTDIKDDKMVQSSMSEDEDMTIRLYAIYDQMDRLVELKFIKNRQLPGIFLKVLGLIIKFQRHLTTIRIHQGLDVYGLYEIVKFIPTCNVTDLCFDGTYLKVGSFGMLFENLKLVKRISLSRCSINDKVLEKIASNLVYPLPASKTLVILNLSSNRITDVGASFIANALRSNRCLSYLNLSGNRLTDIGGELLMSSLIEFKLSEEELNMSKRRQIEYFRRKSALASHILKEIRFDQLKSKKKSTKALVKPAVNKKGKGIEKESSLKAIDVPEERFDTDLDSYLFEKAYLMAQLQLGTFNDPFSRENLVVKDGSVYCNGNNKLCFLSLSYNNLSYISLKKLLRVMKAQRVSHRKPQGIINISIEGNYLPSACIEMCQIESLLDKGTEKISSAGKRSTSKSAATIR